MNGEVTHYSVCVCFSVCVLIYLLFFLSISVNMCGSTLSWNSVSVVVGDVYHCITVNLYIQRRSHGGGDTVT